MAPEAPGRPPRRLARDIRTDREGVVMARPDEFGSRNLYWLRPRGGGREWEVPPEFVQMLGTEAEPR